MERLNTLSEFDWDKYIELSKDLLNRTLKLRLVESDKSLKFNPVLWQKDEKGEVITIADFKGYKESEIANPEEIATLIEEKVIFYKPHQYILIDFNESKPSIFSNIRTLELRTKFSYYGLDWVEKQLNNYPDILEKYNIKFTDSTTTETTDNQEKRYEHIEDLINSGKNFFAAGHIWGKDDKLPQFIEQGYWENGYEEKLTNIVNGVSEGDVVFLKSTFATKTEGILRIKAIGIVTANPHDGHKLKVNWNLTDPIDLPGLGAYRNAITHIGDDNVKRILQGLHDQLPELFKIIDRLERIIIPEPISIDKDYFIKTENVILQSTEFYFQKAIDVLEQLKTYELRTPLKIVTKGSESTKLRLSPFQQLNTHWNDSGKLNSNEFMAYLEKKEQGLIELYELISKFLSYVDEKSWDRQRLNEYGDNRWIANTGLYQTQLVDHFIHFALNDFVMEPDRSGNVFSRVIEYLQSPQETFNILTEHHRKAISRYFLKREYSGKHFHNNLKSYFDQYGFTLANPDNVTGFYKFIIYDVSIRKLWDPNYKSGKKISPEEGDYENEDQFKETVSSSQKEISIAQTASVLNSNDLAHTEKDLLGFEPDVKVLASLMALKKMDPPLAIALFGKWGTGKSFFMYQLEEKVKELAEYQGFLEKKKQKGTKVSKLEDEKYCTGIAQIKFNAWSYLDSNLWAGLVNTIFEKLNEYLTETTKSGVAKLKIREKLTERLISLKTAKISETERKSGLELLRDEYKSEIQQLKKNIQSNFTNQIIEIIGDNPDLNNLHKELVTEGKSIGDVIRIKDSKIVQEYTFWKNFFDTLKELKHWWKYVLGGIAISGGLILFLFIKDQLSFINSTLITSLTLILPKLGINFNSVTRKYYKVRTYAKKINSFLNKNKEQQEKIEEIEGLINNAKNEIKEADYQISELDSKIDSLEFKLENNLASEAIASFIHDRAKHKDYKEYLGIISTIRKDFETLSELFLEYEDEISVTESKETTSLKETEEQKITEDRKVIEEQFKEGKKLERIILYIDDLDRCSDEKVLEVLQAVHLLMAFPLFVVVVGVDKRCVNNALNYKNIFQYISSTGAESLEQLKEEFNIEVIHPNDYLEKIFQIPFQIPSAQPSGVHKMIDDLFEGQVKEIEEALDETEDSSDVKQFEEKAEQKEHEEMKETIADTPEFESDKQEELDGIRFKLKQEKSAELSEIQEKEEVAFESVKDTETDSSLRNESEEYVPITPPDLTIDTAELEQIKNLSGLVGNVPRTIKRFVNLYRILRAHSKLSFDNLSDSSKLAIMFSLALNLGDYKEEAENIFKAAELLDEEALSELITKDILSEIYEELVKNKMEKVLDITGKDINDHLPFIKRFSFGKTAYGDEEDLLKE